MSDIKEHIKEIASTLKSGMSVGEGGVVTAEEGLIEKTLPEDLNMTTVNKVFGWSEDIVAAQTLATGELAEAAMKKDKKLDRVSSELTIGTGRSRHMVTTVGYDRSVTGPKSPSDPTPTTRYGVTSIKVKTKAADGQTGELKKVRTYLNENAAKLFG